MVPKNEKKAVPFGVAYMETAPFAGDWFTAKKDSILAASWVLPDGESDMIDMEDSQGVVFVFKGGAQGGKGVNYILQAVQYGVDKKIYPSPEVCIVGDTFGLGLANRGVDLGTAMLVVGLPRAEMHASLSAFAAAPERKQGGAFAGMTEYAAAKAHLDISLLPTLAPNDSECVFDADDIAAEHYMFLASDIDSSAFGKGGEGGSPSCWRCSMAAA